MQTFKELIKSYYYLPVVTLDNEWFVMDIWRKQA